jgi:hypothetical protein
MFGSKEKAITFAPAFTAKFIAGLIKGDGNYKYLFF